jgi:general stress protein YciG
MIHDDDNSIREATETTTTTESAQTTSDVSNAEPPRRRRGFAAMDPKLVSELASRGGKAAQRAGTAHRFNSEEARVAGRKGGQATGAKRRAKATGSN